MARRKTKSSSRPSKKQHPAATLVKMLLKTKAGRRALVGVNVLIVLVGIGWFFTQPAERRAEIQTLVSNYMDSNKQVSLPELAWDIWAYYYSGQFVDSDFRGGDAQIYGGLPERNGFPHTIKVLQNTGYVTGYADAIKNPAWVAYRLFDQADPKEPGERPDNFDADTRTFTKVRSSDYTGSGYDRGHMAPNYGIARTYGTEAQEETFLMSNIIPQTHSLNAGPWKELEMRAANNYPSRYQEIWVITGPVFSQSPKKTKTGVPIPDSCFKIIVDETQGSLRMMAFLMPQDVDGIGDLKYFLTSVDTIEELTGLNFFPDLEDGVEEELESRTLNSVW